MPAAATASGNSSTHQRGAANGRASWIQASGEAQDSQDGPLAPAESPTPRSTKATPSTASAIPRAVRALAVSWAATAVIPVKASPQQPMPSASATEPAAGRPTSGRATQSSTEVARTPVAAVTNPATRAACRPTTAEPTSSSRPASSSDLVCLITTKMASSATKTPAQTPYRQAVSEPREEPSSLPYRNRRAGLPPPVSRERGPAGRGRVQLPERVGRAGHPGSDHVDGRRHPDPVPPDGEPGQFAGPGQPGGQPPRMGEDGHRGAPATGRSAE